MFYFFFQAEDGIRDVAVTGVKTCALPICMPIGSTYEIWLYHKDGGSGTSLKIGRASCREECRSRWSPHHLKKKKTPLANTFPNQTNEDQHNNSRLSRN